jgi:hypothetical protein
MRTFHISGNSSREVDEEHRRAELEAHEDGDDQQERAEEDQPA